MDSDAIAFINTLRADNIDPLLLLYLTAPPSLMKNQPWLCELLQRHYKECMLPFHSRIVSLLRNAATPDLLKQLLDFCDQHHQDFVKGSKETIDALFDLIDAHLLTLPASAWCTLQEPLQRARSDAHATFKGFLLTVSKQVADIRPISPCKFVVALKKDQVKEEYQKVKVKWGVHAPFFFQTFNAKEPEGIVKGSSVFFIFRTAADGLSRLLDMLSAGATSVTILDRPLPFTVMGALEHALDEETLCYPIMDWEIMLKFFGGRCSKHDCLWIMKEFPEILLREWTQAGILGDGPVHVYYKNKSRDKRNAHKLSMHVVLNVLAERAHHNAALDAFVETRVQGHSYKEWIDRAKAASDANGGALPLNFPSVQGEHDFLVDPFTAVYPFDIGASRGNGFSTAFSRKDPKDPFSLFWGKTEYKRGVTHFAADNPTHVQFQCDFKKPHDLKGYHMGRANRLLLLHEQCYTTPKFGNAFYEEAFMQSVKPKAPVSFAPIGVRTRTPLTLFVPGVGAGGGGQAGHPQQLLRADCPARMAAVRIGGHDGQGDLKGQPLQHPSRGGHAQDPARGRERHRVHDPAQLPHLCKRPGHWKGQRGLQNARQRRDQSGVDRQPGLSYLRQRHS
jgi:hypothetical protein